MAMARQMHNRRYTATLRGIAQDTDAVKQVGPCADDQELDIRIHHLGYGKHIAQVITEPVACVRYGEGTPDMDVGYNESTLTTIRIPVQEGRFVDFEYDDELKQHVITIKTGRRF